MSMEAFKYFKESDINRDELIDETIKAVRYADLSQSSFSDDEIDKKKQEIEDYLEESRKEKVTLPEDLLAEKLADNDLEKSEISSQMLNDFNFYQVIIPIGLKAKNNWAFTHLECHLRFYIKEENSKYAPIIHSIYPCTERRDSINVGIILKSALDSKIIYRTLSNYAGLTQKSPTEENISNGTGLKITGQPFEYKSFRYDVKAEIVNESCKWILKGNQYVEDESQKLRIVLRVAKMGNQLFSECGVVARHKPEIIEFFHNFTEFPKKVKAFISGGLEIKDYACYEHNYPKNHHYHFKKLKKDSK